MGTAERFLERSIAIHEKTGGPHVAALAAVLSELGGILCARGNYEQGRILMARAVAIEERTGGANLLKWLTNLSTAHIALDDFGGAERLLERALTLGGEAGGGDAQVDVTLLNLAAVRRQQEDFADPGACSNELLRATKRCTGQSIRRWCTRWRRSASCPPSQESLKRRVSICGGRSRSANGFSAPSIPPLRRRWCIRVECSLPKDRRSRRERFCTSCPPPGTGFWSREP